MTEINNLFESDFASEQSTNIPMLGVSMTNDKGKNVPFEDVVIESIVQGSWGDDANNKTLDVEFIKYEDVDGVSTAIGRNNTRIFNPFQAEYYGGEAKSATDLINDFIGFRTDMQHLLSPYFPSNELNFNVWANTKITSGEILEKIIEKNDVNTLIGMFDTIFSNVIEFVCTKYSSADKSIKVKVKFERQSKAKHYPKLPKYRTLPKNSNRPIYNPFIADMNDVEACKKVKYSNYERGLDKSGKPRDNGFDRSSGEEIQTEQAATAAVNSEVAELDAVFGEVAPTV